MAWFFFPERRRGPQWKQGWAGQTLTAASLPPPPLVAVFAIVILLMSLSGYADYKAQVRKTAVGFRLVLLVIPVALVFAVRGAFRGGRFALWVTPPEQGAIHRAGSSPWGVAVVVALVLLMVSYQSYFHSQWFPALWRSGY